MKTSTRWLKRVQWWTFTARKCFPSDIAMSKTIPTEKRRKGTKMLSIAPVIIQKLFPDDRSATLCAGIYMRSWPTTAGGNYSDDQIRARLTSRSLSYWKDLIDRSSLALLGSNSHGQGFCLVTPGDKFVELSYLFVEPEAFGTGLAATLCEQAELTSDRILNAWILSGNERSQRFFTRRGWEPRADVGQPDWSVGDAQFVLFRQRLVKHPIRRD